MHYKLASLILNSEQKTNSISDIFIAQPDTAKEALVGKLFILAEIKSQKNEAAKIIDFIINNINFNYYQNEKVILKEKIDTISIENIFESALAKTNKDLIDFLTKEKIKISPLAFNLTVCVICQNELYFSVVGKNKNLLLYKEKISPNNKMKNNGGEKTEYKLNDIGKSKEDDVEGATINKLFSEIFSGKIPVNGYFIIINEALSEYLSAKEMIEITTRLSPSGAVEQIKNILEKINSYVSFLGIIVKNTAETNLSDEELKKKIENEIKNWDYKPEIVTTEEKTEAILKSSGTINIKKWLKLLMEKIKPINKNSNNSPAPLGSRAGKIFILKDKIFVKKRMTIFTPKKLVIFLNRLGELLDKIYQVIFSKIKIAKENKNKPADIEPANKTGASFFSGKKRKFFFSVGIILILILITNIYLIKNRNEKNAILKAFNIVISNINKNQAKIDALLLYGNNDEAKKIWEENENLLSKLNEEEKTGREDIVNFINKQRALLDKINKINAISDFKKIADFSNLNKEASPENLTILEDRIYAADANQKAIYKINIKEDLITADYNLGDISEMKQPSITANGLAYLDKTSIIEINKDGGLQKIEIENMPENIGGAGIYNNRLYLADKKNGQIRRYSKQNDKFSLPTDWLKNPTDFSSAVKIFIDGNIYVLIKNGQIEKYLKGERENLSLDTVNEPITEASNFIIGEKNIYVFELSKKRLVVFNELGRFQNQYIFSNLEDVKDFTVSEKDKKVYILSGQSIYETTIN